MQLLGAAALWPAAPALATGDPQRIRWTDLIPNGLPYGEIVGRGFVDAEEDVWIPEFDANGSALNTDLDGAYIELAGYMIPLELTADGVTEFVLVPYVGACIHTPPPPPNQLVFASSAVPWPQRNLWDAVLVTGNMQARMMRTDLAQVGYTLETTYIEDFKR
ncbi:hypothetical protein AVJ23_21265 [Pseudoponticoccus marisrubri]|uniref:DUF3299 domain-containing protein n=1 Tax=Pseudoponticoccus marisrubri TaxID=1685382 RepID=A0A0W7WDL0_9RHOB|nr:hypothetical protein AVJ23_21265 [Pseudoponticoccus marisrubri]